MINHNFVIIKDNIVLDQRYSVSVDSQVVRAETTTHDLIKDLLDFVRAKYASITKVYKEMQNYPYYKYSPNGRNTERH